MCTIGIFIIGHALSSAFGYRKSKGPILWQKLVAMVRYLAYRGFHIRALGWSSAPVGVLILGLIGTIFFFCKPATNAWRDCELIYLRAWFWPPNHITGQISCLVDRHHSQLALAGWLWRVCEKRFEDADISSATATKTNWITLLTGVSHERLQVFHRWISYAFFILALLHTFPWYTKFDLTAAFISR
jgi:hypothetical protein